MSQSPPAFRLAVWKPAHPVRRLIACSTVKSGLDCELHEQVYSWETEEYIWGSLENAEQTSRARAALVEAFDPSKPVRERSIERLHEALIVLEDILRTTGATSWRDCEESVKTSNDDQTNLRANTVLLLYRHLQWVWEIFKHVPGASVTVR